MKIYTYKTTVTWARYRQKQEWFHQWNRERSCPVFELCQKLLNSKHLNAHYYRLSLLTLQNFLNFSWPFLLQQNFNKIIFTYSENESFVQFWQRRKLKQNKNVGDVKVSIQETKTGKLNLFKTSKRKIKIKYLKLSI